MSGLDAETAHAIGALEAVSTDAEVFAPPALKGIALRAIEELRRLAALTAEPSRVEDTEVETVLRDFTQELSHLKHEDDERLWIVGSRAADLIRRLAAAKASAERTGTSAEYDLLIAKKDKDAAYAERNKLVAFLASRYPSGVTRTDIPGWDAAWHGCVFIETPEGQMSWHFHDSEAPLFAHLPPYTKSWDGHSTEAKYERLARLAKSETAEAKLRDARAEVYALKGAPKPRAFDLDTWADWLRLVRETRGYLHTCWRQHSGGDREGRFFAEDALTAMETRLEGHVRALSNPE